MNYFTRINHITLSTSNLAVSIDFYKNQLHFSLIAEWEQGAYLQSGEIWLCLSLEKEFDNTAKSEYSHIAFNLHPSLFEEINREIEAGNVSQWKQNGGEGESLYLLDPDNHKLEIHCGDLYSRIQSVLKRPYKGFKVHQIPECLMPPIQVLDGQYVKLIPLELSHLEGLYKVGSHSEIWKLLPRNEFSSIEDSKQWIIESLNQNNHRVFTIFNQNNEILGSTRYLDINHSDKSLEIGYTWLHPSVWRTFVNTECKYLLLSYAFEVLEYKRIFLKTDIRNTRSQNAIERLGAVKEGVLRASMRLNNDYWRDSVYYSILDYEWPQIKSRLKQS